MKRLFLLVLFCATVPYALFAQLDKVNQKLLAFKQDSSLMHASWSFCLVDNSSNKVLAEKDKNIALPPASSLKTITTATALALLGKDYQYKTQIYYTGTIQDAKLIGNIVIQGSGDPTLGSDRILGVASYTQLISGLVDSIKQLGIKQISGKIIADESCFSGSSIPNTWNWSDIGNYYGAGASGINFNENSYDIIFNPCAKNLSIPLIKSVEPNIPNLRFTNHLLASDTIENMDDAYIYGASTSEERELAGLVPLSTKEFLMSGAIPDPGLLMAQMLQDALIKNDVSVSDAPQSIMLNIEYRSQIKHPICTYTSPILEKIITFTNQKSINLYAEALLKTIALAQGKNATTENGIAIVQEYWSSKGIDLTGFYMRDGSGLSRHNAVSPAHFTAILAQISKEKYFETFEHSLAVAGQVGTLKGLCAGTIAEGRVFAKSGTIERGISYTGYVHTLSGKTLNFSIIFNNYTSKNLVLRQKIAQLMIAMVGI